MVNYPASPRLIEKIQSFIYDGETITVDAHALIGRESQARVASDRTVTGMNSTTHLPVFPLLVGDYVVAVDNYDAAMSRVMRLEFITQLGDYDPFPGQPRWVHTSAMTISQSRPDLYQSRHYTFDMGLPLIPVELLLLRAPFHRYLAQAEEQVQDVPL